MTSSTSEKSLEGLSQVEAERRLLANGPNTLPEPNPLGLGLIFLRQYKSPFIYILFVAALVSLLLGQVINCIFIFVVLLLNASIGTFQEYAAQKAASGLKKMVPHHATVYRDDKPVVVDASEVVPGDLLLLVSGDKVPADIHLREALELQVDESMLTGESLAIEKNPGRTSSDDTALGDRLDRVYAGTIVLRGRGRGEVISTGSNTEIGKIATDVAADEASPPPLMLRIHEFTLRVTYAILILISLIFVITLMRGDNVTTVFFLGVALAVSAIPEGLPVAITVALAIGMRKMAGAGVIIRNLIAVESLGSCTFIASDKTGTLTVNEMTIRTVVLADGTRFSISGEGTNLNGEVAPETNAPGENSTKTLDLLLAGGLLANEAYLENSGDECTGHGDAVDVAFLVLAEKAGLEITDERNAHTELGTIPYESQLAYAASVNSYHGRVELFVKGSVERLIEMSTKTKEQLDMLSRAEELAKKGYRVLGIAHRTLDVEPKSPHEYLDQLELLGIVGMIDPLRPEVIEAVKECRNAHIKIAMITGDHPDTASVLAAELGISRGSINRSPDPVVTGQELTKAMENGQSAFDELVQGTRVFARVAPRQKMEIVQSLISQGEFVGVTGDGINDAPALKHAHIGISMGKRGSDVARENSDMILTDDNFASIVKGVREGRIVYNNIRKVIFLLISTGAAEITLILLSILFGMPLPLLPLQLLWLNLVTNGIQDVALVFEPEEGHELKQKPRSPNEPIFNRQMIERVIVNAIVMGVLAFIVFYWQIQNGATEESARNVTLLLMVLFENVHVFNSRSETLSIFRQYFFGNPFLLFGMLAAQAVHIIAMHIPGLNTVLGIEPVSLALWGQLLLVALCLILVDEVHKWIRARSHAVSV